MGRRVPVKIALGERAAAFYRAEAEKREMTLAGYLASLLQELAVAEARLAIDVGTPHVEASQRKSKKEPAARTAASGYKGVYRYGKRWAAVLWIDGRQERLGVYDTAEDAARAYDTAALARFGGAADLNFADANVQPYLEKLANDAPLSDIEWQELRRRTGSTTSPAPLAIEGEHEPPPLSDRAPIRLFKRPASPPPEES